MHELFIYFFSHNFVVVVFVYEAQISCYEKKLLPSAWTLEFFFFYLNPTPIHIFSCTQTKICIKPLVDNKDYIDVKIIHQNMGKPASKHFLSWYF